MTKWKKKHLLIWSCTLRISDTAKQIMLYIGETVLMSPSPQGKTPKTTPKLSLLPSLIWSTGMRCADTAKQFLLYIRTIPAGTQSKSTLSGEATLLLFPTAYPMGANS